MASQTADTGQRSEPHVPKVRSLEELPALSEAVWGPTKP